ncbi:Uncharacterised protein [Mycobacterium tuberculosis]|nr:Uncharacterised protein [Mycobacterium tuberculosis]
MEVFCTIRSGAPGMPIRFPALLPACPLGRINENTKEPINPVITISTPISTARD